MARTSARARTAHSFRRPLPTGLAAGHFLFTSPKVGPLDDMPSLLQVRRPGAHRDTAHVCTEVLSALGLCRGGPRACLVALLGASVPRHARPPKLLRSKPHNT